MTAKLSYATVKELIEKDGYGLISKEYVNSFTKLETRCPNGHDYRVSFNAFTKAKSRCPICLGRTPHSFDSVKSMLKDLDYTLVTNHYENMHQKLDSICPNGHFWCFSLDNFVSNNSRCPTCKGIKSYTLEEIKEILKKQNFSLVSDYKNTESKTQVICPKGHEISIRLTQFISAGLRCKICTDAGRRFKFEYIKEFIEKEGYVLISKEYRNKDSKLDIICPKGHILKLCFGKFKNRGDRCGSCSANTSIAELELFNAVKIVFTNTKKLKDTKAMILGKPYIKGFDIDIFVPELDKGIEFDGTYWHSFEAMRKNKKKSIWSDEDIRNYHQLKDSWFASKGIQILHIKEEDWNLDKEACIKRCLEFLAK